MHSLCELSSPIPRDSRSYHVTLPIQLPCCKVCHSHSHSQVSGAQQKSWRLPEDSHPIRASCSLQCDQQRNPGAWDRPLQLLQSPEQSTCPLQIWKRDPRLVLEEEISPVLEARRAFISLPCFPTFHWI